MADIDYGDFFGTDAPTFNFDINDWLLDLLEETSE